MAMIKRVGYGQVEPNHLSAQRNGQVYGQLPAAAEIEVLENGQFVKYDYANGVCNFEGAGEWMLVYNEVKLYDSFWRESYKDFAMKKTDYVDGEMVPRLFKTNVGDIFTTNTLGANTSEDAETTAVTVVEGNILVVGSTGYLEVAGQSPTGPQFKVVAITTMPDGQDAVKLQRVQ